MALEPEARGIEDCFRGVSPAFEGLVQWPGGIDLRLKIYLTNRVPPVQYVSSVRAIVFKDDAVLVVRDPDVVHIIPGGRRESGETIEETAGREVLEETGWSVRLIDVIGVRDIERLTPRVDDEEVLPLHFLQLVYLAEANEHIPEAREKDGRELEACFWPLARLDEVDLQPDDRVLLAAAAERRGR